jgi:hypothetical protein
LGIIVFEKSADADLHAHCLIHAPPRERATIRRFEDGPWVTVKQVYNLRGLLGYVTKQRQRLSPDFEKRINRRWQSAMPIPGPRWTLTGDAKKALASETGPTCGRTDISAAGRDQPPGYLH